MSEGEQKKMNELERKKEGRRGRVSQCLLQPWNNGRGRTAWPYTP